MQVRIERIKAPTNRTLIHWLNRALPEVEKALNGPVKSLFIDGLEATVTGWDHKPSFSDTFKRTGDALVLEMYPSGPDAFKWRIIGGGFGPRTIVSSKNLMSFPREYNARTKPGGRYGGVRQKYGERVYNRRTVGPHKIEARHFSKEVIKRRKAQAVKEIAESFKRAVNNA